MTSGFNLKDHTFHSNEFYEIINEAVEFLLSSPIRSMPPDNVFFGGGIYLLYYFGSSEYYSRISEMNQENLTLPIYAGKAVPTGWRQARSTGSDSKTLYSRLREHSKSIEAVKNLKVENFKCRFAILKDVESNMISTVEASLIRRFQPLWNCEIDGYGNHDPGKNRYGQLLADWDSLHPGRNWEQKWHGPKKDTTELKDKIDSYMDNLES